MIFGALLLLVLGVVLAQLSEGGLDSKALALLGVLSALGAAVRPLGAGTAGVETIFFLLVVSGRALGPGFGFSLGCTTLFASALITGGVGPWMPYQMFACAWIGLGAGLLPTATGRREIAMLVRVRRGVGVLLRLPAQPVVLAVHARRARRGCRSCPARPSSRTCTATCCSTPPRHSAGTPAARSPTRS